MLLSLELPPGVHRSGTDLQVGPRWIDASLVRWTEGTMRPVGGWEERLAVSSEPPRAALAWQDLSNDYRFAVGAASGLYAVTGSGLVSTITPDDLAIGDVHARLNTGFGGGAFGLGRFGTVRSDPGGYGEATTWALDTWGQDLIACSTADRRIHAWPLTGLAQPVPNAPTALAAMVTAERFLVALGAGGNPRRVQWSDREDRETWTPAATNQAGSLDLQTSGQIMCGLRIRGAALILTDQDAHAMTYQGPPFVYGFEMIGANCGAVSRKATAAIDGNAYWMGARGFFACLGGQVQPIPCTVTDAVFADLNDAQISKVWAVPNAQFGEVWWFYPSNGSIECDRYVAFSYKEGHWAIGSLARTAGFDRGVFRNPIWFSPQGVAFNHEKGRSHDGSPVYAETGPIRLGDGERVMHVVGLRPDERAQGDVEARFYARFHPNGEERAYGPYAMGLPTSCRFAGRQVRMRLEATRNADWRVGVMTLDVRPAGLR
jgi:hypothetical protein